LVPKTKTRSTERVNQLLFVHSPLRQDKLYAGLHRKIVALQNGDRGESAVLSPGVPALGVSRLAFAFDGRCAHDGREHAPRAPAPDFLAREISHDEVVGLTAGETQLEHLARVVPDVEREAESFRITARSRNVEFGDDRCAAFGVAELRSSSRLVVV